MSIKNPASAAAGITGGLEAEVSAEAAPLLQFIIRHVRLIVGAVFILILAIALVGAYQWYTAKTLSDARFDLGLVLTGTGDTDKISALEKLKSHFPDKMQEGLLLEIALAALQADNYDKVAEVYAEICKMDPGPFAIIAAINQSEALLKSGKPDAALQVLEDIERIVPKDMRLILMENMAIAADNAGNIPKAISALEAVIAESDINMDMSFYRERIRLLKGSQKIDEQSATVTE